MSKRDTRRLYGDPEFEPFALALGRVTLAWNSLHVALFGLFWAVSGYANRLIPGAIWHALKVDRAQRDILKNFAASNVLGISIPNNIRTEIAWILNEANVLENDRNNLLHTPFAINENGVFALHLGQHKRGITLSGKEMQAYANWLFSRIMMLTEYAEQLEEPIRRSHLSLPKRPSLPARPASNAPKRRRQARRATP